MNVLGICGSLRVKSSNAALLRAAARFAPAGMHVTIFEGLGALPHFNPDLDTDEPPAVVRDFRALVAAADGLIISTPEYAHNIPGSLKNALDWLVSSPEIIGKPIVLMNASTSGGERAQASLIQTLTAMSTNVLTDASLLAPFVHKKLDAEGNVTDETIVAKLRRSLDALGRAGVPPATDGRPARR